MHPIKIIVFDSYGTLFDVHSVITRAEQLFPGHGKRISEIWRQKQLEYTWLRSLMGRYRDFWKVTDDSLAFTLKALGLHADPAIRNSILQEYLILKPFPDVLAALEHLKHNTLAILSNGTPHMLNSVLNHTGLRHYFSAVFSVDAVKVYKPYPEVYRMAFPYNGVRKEEILYVSGNAFDAAGAKAFGYTVCWVNRSNSTFEELDVTPDLVISGFDQLKNLFAVGNGH